MKPIDANTNKVMLPDMEHKFKITRTWHELVESMQIYLTYKNFLGKDRLSSRLEWIGRLTTIYLLTKYYKSENNKFIDPIMDRLFKGERLKDIDLISVTDFLNKKLDSLGLTNFDIDREDPVTKYRMEFK